MDVNKQTTSPTDAELDALYHALESFVTGGLEWRAAQAIAALRRERDEVVALAENAEARRTEVALQLETLRKLLDEAACVLRLSCDNDELADEIIAALDGTEKK